jgi:hypothetical protein
MGQSLPYLAGQAPGNAGMGDEKRNGRGGGLTGDQAPAVPNGANLKIHRYPLVKFPMMG